MARKKSVSNQSARREEIVDYDVKRLRQMSAKELQDYYNRVEPLSDDEVNAIYDRVMPKIAYEIASNNQHKKPRHIGSSIKKTVLVAICMTLMLSVVAQALGIPVWETIVSWTRDHLILRISHTDNTIPTSNSERSSFSQSEKETWGDDICNAFEELNFYPALPNQKPSNLKLDDLFYTIDDIGGIYLSALFTSTDDDSLILVVERIPDEQYDTTYTLATERDLSTSKEIDIDGITYYYVTNIDTISFTWQNDNAIFSIFTTYDADIIVKMLESIEINIEE